MNLILTDANWLINISSKRDLFHNKLFWISMQIQVALLFIHWSTNLKFLLIYQNFPSHLSLIHLEASLDMAEKLYQRKQTGSDQMINKG